jgi:hypothetical protein
MGYSTAIMCQNFPGNTPELLIGKELKVLEVADILQQYGYKGFYKDINLKKIYDKNSSFASKYESLVNKVFKVNGCEPYTNLIGKKRFKLELSNPDIGTLYFDYNPKFEEEFQFEVIGGLQYPEGYLCKDIEESKDKFTGKTYYNSPMLDKVYFSKVVENNNSTIYLHLTCLGKTLLVNKQGVVVLLKDGNKLDFPTALVDVKVDNTYANLNNYSYSAFIELNKEDIDKLIKSEITDYRLYLYDDSVKNGLKYCEYLKCLSK